MTALRVVGLSHCYGDRVVLDDVSFELAAGEVVAIVGPSGAGKTTLFRSITQLVRPDAGRVELGGRDLTALSGAELRTARRDIGLVFQQYNLIRRLSALDNVLAGRLADLPTWRVLTRTPGASERASALDCLERVGLGHRSSSRADRLSGGEQQRVAIARALAQRSRVVLADEPVSSLDPTSADNVLGALRSIARDDGIAVLCSLHQVAMVTGFADRVLGLRQGKVVLDLAGADFDEGQRDRVYAAQ
ncbi:MAG: phosphonate ABC transporter ATP-binding protein [Acidimicrobiales bacterium]